MQNIIIAVIGCGVINIIATAIINAINNKKTKLDEIDKKLDEVDKKFDGVDKRFDSVDKSLIKSEKDSLRTQLLLMLADYPDNTEGILAIGERYFGKLHGNWYATALFNGWLESKGIAKPEWFKEEQ